MSTHRDPDRLVHDFLMEGQTELADQVFDAVRATIEHKNQRVVIGPWRSTFMNKFAALGLGTAAVVAVVVIGTLYFGARVPGGVGAPPSATPTPVTASHILLGGPPQITVDIPAGWTGVMGVLEKGENGADPPDGAGMITFAEPLYVYGDPCRWSSTRPGVPATTVDELVVALSAQAGRDASAPVDVTLDGHAGKSIILHVPDDAVFGDCDEDQFASWGTDTEPGPGRHHQGPGQIDELWIMDVDGVLTVIDTAYFAETPAADVEEMRAIVESATFTSP